MDNLWYMSNRIDQSYVYKFTPQEDITAYELACLLPLLFSNDVDILEIIEKQTPQIQRHFTKESF